MPDRPVAFHDLIENIQKIPAKFCIKIVIFHVWYGLVIELGFKREKIELERHVSVKSIQDLTDLVGLIVDVQ